MKKLMTNNYMICEMPKQKRPYEKCEAYGPESLSDTELLAVILRNGTQNKSSLELADEVLNLGENKDLTNLMDFSGKELMRIKGIGRVKCIELQCVAEMSRRIWRSSAKRRLDLDNPSSIASYYMEDLRHLKVEQVYIMMFDIRDGFIKSSFISKGTIDASMVSPREIFAETLRFSAASFVLVHNHPSGNIEPSDADIKITKLLITLGKVMNVPIKDSIIIGENCYFSFFEKGLLHE